MSRFQPRGFSARSSPGGRARAVSWMLLRTSTQFSPGSGRAWQPELVKSGRRGSSMRYASCSPPSAAIVRPRSCRDASLKEPTITRPDGRRALHRKLAQRCTDRPDRRPVSLLARRCREITLPTRAAGRESLMDAASVGGWPPWRSVMLDLAGPNRRSLKTVRRNMWS